MPVAIVTGSAGLIGSESVRHFVQDGYEVIGLENGVLSGNASCGDRRQLGCTKELAYVSPEKDSLRRRARACGMTYRVGPSFGTGFLGPSGGWLSVSNSANGGTVKSSWPRQGLQIKPINPE